MPSAKAYEEQLRAEVNAEREALGKLPIEDDNDETSGQTPVETVEKTVSTTDPDSGMFAKGEHERQRGWGELYSKVTAAFPEIEAIAADFANKTPNICKKAFDDGRVLSTAYKRPRTMKGGHKWWKYVYDEYYDRIICPEYQILCTRSKACVKTVRRHIWQDYEELVDDARYTPEHAEL